MQPQPILEVDINGFVIALAYVHISHIFYHLLVGNTVEIDVALSIEAPVRHHTHRILEGHYLNYKAQLQDTLVRHFRRRWVHCHREGRSS